MSSGGKLRLVAVMVFVLLVFYGCTGGGGGDDSNPVPDPDNSESPIVDNEPPIDDNEPPIENPTPPSNPPTATLFFPTLLSITDSDSLEVTGTATDPDGDAILYVRVNGVDATTEDGYVTWRTNIPLNPGDNLISIEVADDNAMVNNLDDIANVSFRGPAILKPAGLDIDTTSNILYVSDMNQNTVMSVDTRTGMKTLVSGPGKGSGTSINGLYGLALDAANDRIIVVDSDTNGLFSINPANGDRAVISSMFVGNGPQFVGPLNVDVNENTEIAYVVDRTQKAIVAVDLNSGDRSIISSNTIGSGVSFADPFDIAVNTTNDNLLVLDVSLDAVIEVSIDTGARTIVTSVGVGGGTTIDSPEAISYDPINNQAIVTCIDYVLKVNLNNGLKTLVSGLSRGSGQAFDFIRSAAVSGDGNTIYVAEYFDSNIVAVTVANGNRQNLSSTFVGSGIHYTAPRHITYGILDNHITVVDRRNIVDVNLLNGERRVITGDNVGLGQAITGFDGGFFDRATDSLYVLNGVEESLLSVDYNNGNRTVISQPGSVIGSGVNWPQANAFAVKSSTNMAYTFHFNHPMVYQADLQTGARSEFSGGMLGLGFPIYTLRDGLYDSENDRLLVVDSVSDSIMSIHPDSGDRTLLSSRSISISSDGILTTFPQTGTGPVFAEPLGIGVDDSGDTAYVADRDLNALFKVDLLTGNRTVLSDNDHGVGPNFADPSKVFVDSEKGIAYVADFGFRAVYAVELGTGDRVIVSK